MATPVWRLEAAAVWSSEAASVLEAAAVWPSEAAAVWLLEAAAVWPLEAACGRDPQDHPGIPGSRVVWMRCSCCDAGRACAPSRTMRGDCLPSTTASRCCANATPSARSRPSKCPAAAGARGCRSAAPPTRAGPAGSPPVRPPAGCTVARRARSLRGRRCPSDQSSGRCRRGVRPLTPARPVIATSASCRMPWIAS